jgi:hypothetical protein
MMIPFSGMPRMPTRRSRAPRSEKALVRAVARVGEGSPAKCGSAQESDADEAYALCEAQARDEMNASAAEKAVRNHRLPGLPQQALFSTPRTRRPGSNTASARRAPPKR